MQEGSIILDGKAMMGSACMCLGELSAVCYGGSMNWLYLRQPQSLSFDIDVDGM